MTSRRPRIAVRPILLHDALGRFLKLRHITTAKSSRPARRSRRRRAVTPVQLALF